MDAQILAEMNNMRIRIDERDGKVANQAVVITKLEQSRKDLRKVNEQLVRVARAARCADDVLDRITQSFPDNEVPHPSIEECLNAYCDLHKALKEVDHLL